MMHTTKDGAKMPITEMSDRHLLNTMRMLKRRAADGLTIRRGGGWEADEMWYDEDIIFGTAALNELNYSAYKTEADNRKLQTEEPS